MLAFNSSALYAGFRILRLTENMRLSSLRNDPNATETELHFPDYLLRLGEGRLETAEDGMVKLPESVPKVLYIDTLCSAVLDGLESNYSDVSWLISRAILSNNRIIEINSKVGSRLPGSYKTFLSADSVKDEDQNGLRYTAELLNNLNRGKSLPDRLIQLKEGFVVTLFAICALRMDMSMVRGTFWSRRRAVFCT